MAEPTAQQVHIDQALTNIAIRYSNEKYVFDQIFPRVPVQKQTDKFFKFTKEHWFRDDAMPRAPGTRAVPGSSDRRPHNSCARGDQRSTIPRTRDPRFAPGTLRVRS